MKGVAEFVNPSPCPLFGWERPRRRAWGFPEGMRERGVSIAIAVDPRWGTRIHTHTFFREFVLRDFHGPFFSESHFYKERFLRQTTVPISAVSSITLGPS